MFFDRYRPSTFPPMDKRIGFLFAQQGIYLIFSAEARTG
jgi:hypothetical protein